MLVELRTKSQLTLPREIVSSLGLSEGDKLDVSEQNGVITMTPVKVYPKRYVDNLRDEINRLKATLQAQKEPDFGALDALLEGLEKA